MKSCSKGHRACGPEMSIGKISPDHFEGNMKEKEKIVCSICKQEVKDTGFVRTWYAEYWNDKILKVICKECHDKGERFK